MHLIPPSKRRCGAIRYIEGYRDGDTALDHGEFGGLFSSHTLSEPCSFGQLDTGLAALENPAALTEARNTPVISTGERRLSLARRLRIWCSTGGPRPYPNSVSVRRSNQLGTPIARRQGPGVPRYGAGYDPLDRFARENRYLRAWQTARRLPLRSTCSRKLASLRGVNTMTGKDEPCCRRPSSNSGPPISGI